MRKALSVAEHGILQIGNGSEETLTPSEAECCELIAERRPGFCTRQRDSIRFANYAGLVHVGERMLEILPKVEGSDAPLEECRGIFLRLLRLAPSLRVHLDGTAAHAVRRGALLEIFLHSFFDEVALLVRGGLLRHYRSKAEDLPLVRGRIDLARQATALSMRPDLIACRYQRLSSDNRWNQTIKAALRLCRSWIGSVDLGRRWAELWAAFDEVEIPSDSVSVAASLTPDRQSRRYAPAIRWAKWIVASESPALRAGSSEAPAMLFDTNLLFEEAVATSLRRRIAAETPTLGVLRTQSRGRSLARSERTGQAQLGLRPDLVLELRGDALFIADTKWKSVAMRRGELRPSASDAYQMFAYAAAFQCGRLVLLYPKPAGPVHGYATALELAPIGGIRPRLEKAFVDVGLDDLPISVDLLTSDRSAADPSSAGGEC